MSKVLHLLVASILALAWAPAAAQTPADERPVRRIEASIGGGLFGGASLGDEDANLRANSAQPQPFRLFSTDLSVAASPSLDARVSFALTRRYEIEGHIAFGHPELRAAVDDDFEDASASTAVESIDQWIFDAGIVVMLDEFRFGGVVPFASAGAGYLRQLHEGLTLIENGQAFYVGGGIKHWLFARQGRFLKASGVRADVRLYLLTGGIEFDSGVTPHGTVSGSFFVTF